ncbi:MAG: peptidase M1 [Gammaproteobacteria bacterium]|nr:MAG: peptidase M1 [Gammaproteobacteria bacterium]
MLKKSLLIPILSSFILLYPTTSCADNLQSQNTTSHHQDTLRGSITPERAWWDLLHYHLSVAVNIKNKTINGSNVVTYKVLTPAKRLQIDLQSPMQLSKVEQNGKTLTVEQDGNAYLISTIAPQPIGSTQSLTLYFSGKPQIAKHAPWDGGITWAKDENGNDFIASSNQGIGASIWWPNKDHGYDEPDNGVLISVTVPEQLMDVSNGRLIKTEHNKKQHTKTYHWQVTQPINNYSVNINIGDYVHFDQKFYGKAYQGENGQLDMDYYVLRDNLAKAQQQFIDAKRTLEALEYWFGPYPFYQDSYKLVQVPYLGMEHQSSVTYGNKFKNGYLGRDRSQTGGGMLFDFIIAHESGHEWFANNITAKDLADLWIHEAFTTYSESLFLEYHYDQATAFKYIRGQRLNIKNTAAIIGQYNVNKEGSGDMYDKGSNMLHTIRQIINNDKKWRDILRGLNKTFYHQTVTSAQIEHYISAQANIDLSKVFDQYLRDVRIPSFEYFINDTTFKYRWGNVIENFDMPLTVSLNDKRTELKPTTKWQTIKLNSANSKLVVDANYYVSSLNLLGE